MFLLPASRYISSYNDTLKQQDNRTKAANTHDSLPDKKQIVFL